MTSDANERGDDRVRWLMLLLRRVGLLLVVEVERELGMESSVLTKAERERRKLEQKHVA